MADGYGQTDVMHDRNYLMALMRRGPHDPLAQTAKAQWELLNQQEAQQASLGATQANLEEQIRSRETGQALTREQIAQRDRETAGYRADVLAQRGQEMQDRESARTLASVQSLMEAYPGPEGQKRAQAVLNQYLAGRGITMPAAAPDAATVAAQQFAASQGKPVVGGAPTPTTPAAQPTAGAPQVTGAPATTPAAGAPAAPTGARITGSVGVPGWSPPINFAPSGTVAPAPAPTGTVIPPELEYVRPAGTVGYINGRPAGEVIAEGALRTGITPESESGRTALAALTKPATPLGAVAAEQPVTPPPEKKFTFMDWLAGRTTPTGGPAAPQPVTPTFGGKGTGAGSAWEGPTSPGQLATGPTAGPTPEPTPGGPTPTGPFSGSIGNITQGPEPTPAGTPPAVPTPTPRIPDEELKRRLATQTQPQ
jgi:hypothetical protein